MSTFRHMLTIRGQRHADYLDEYLRRFALSEFISLEKNNSIKFTAASIDYEDEEDCYYYDAKLQDDEFVLECKTSYTSLSPSYVLTSFFSTVILGNADMGGNILVAYVSGLPDSYPSSAEDYAGLVTGYNTMLKNSCAVEQIVFETDEDIDSFRSFCHSMYLSRFGNTFSYIANNIYDTMKLYPTYYCIEVASDEFVYLINDFCMKYALYTQNNYGHYSIGYNDKEYILKFENNRLYGVVVTDTACSPESFFCFLEGHEEQADIMNSLENAYYVSFSRVHWNGDDD